METVTSSDLEVGDRSTEPSSSLPTDSSTSFNTEGNFFLELTPAQIDNIEEELMPKCPICRAGVKKGEKYFI